MKYQSINFEDKLSRFGEQWSPKIIAEMNDYQFKIVKIEGDLTVNERSKLLIKALPKKRSTDRRVCISHC